MTCYWDYYSNNFDWNDDAELIRKNVGDKPCDFTRLGFDEAEAVAFSNSGYVVLESHNIVIDRYYGGLLASIDGRCRFPLDGFKRMHANGRNGVMVLKATSSSDISAHLESLAETHRRPLLLRGQIHNHVLDRVQPNPHFVVNGIGELSLMPTLWREAQKANPKSKRNFQSLSLVEWSKVIYSQFDLAEIHRREQILGNRLPMSYSDMEDSYDPLLQQFGCIAQDLSMGHDINLADLLTTLLQHYGLRTPYLDLTADLDIALFFATHKYDRLTDGYDFVGNNDGKSVLYVFSQNNTEMAPHVNNRVLGNLEPLRPIRQSCVICRSDPFAMNLAADFLVAVISLDFELKPGAKNSDYLFPSQKEDAFLAALRQGLRYPEHVAGFRGNLGP
ncbi:hypothetical protein GCM10027093_60250 [Paraburkholderia jirisanensis]